MTTTRRLAFVLSLATPSMLPFFMQGQNPVASKAAGCYRDTLGVWSGPFPSGLTAEHIPPPEFQLDTTMLAPLRQSGYRRVLPQAIGSRRRTFPAGWRAVTSDSIEVYWSTGFAGVKLHLRQHGDTLDGVAEAFYDVIGPTEPTAHIRAVRRICG